MAIQILSVFFFLLVLMHNAAGSLHLKANPSDISPGLTRSLIINCSFTYAQVSNISGIISLIISKSDRQQKFQDLISINAFSPDQINVLSQVNGSILGHIDGNGESFLTIQWTYPGVDEAGMYRCSAHGMDDAGYGTKLIQTANVTSEQPDINQLIDKVSDLQHQLDRQQDIERNQSQNIDYLNAQLDRQENLTNNLVKQLDRQEIMIETLLSLTKNQSDMINKQESHVNMIQTQLDLVKYASYIFNVSNVYKNHVYLLSKIDWNNSTVAEQTCKNYTGYLAEIDDSNEDTFVNEFLATISTSVDVVLISGTDQDHEGVWTYTGSTRNMPYINWYSSEPNQPANNCMVKYRGYQWQVVDYPCTHTWTDRKFLCEVNLQ